MIRYLNGGLKTGQKKPVFLMVLSFMIEVKLGSIKDLQALTSVGPTRQNLVPNPLAVQSLNNRLYIWCMTAVHFIRSYGISGTLVRSTVFMYLVVRFWSSDPA